MEISQDLLSRLGKYTMQAKAVYERSDAALKGAPTMPDAKDITVAQFASDFVTLEEATAIAGYSSPSYTRGLLKGTGTRPDALSGLKVKWLGKVRWCVWLPSLTYWQEQASRSALRRVVLHCSEEDFKTISKMLEDAQKNEQIGTYDITLAANEAGDSSKGEDEQREDDPITMLFG